MPFVEPLDVFFTAGTPGIVPAVYNAGATIYGEFEITYFGTSGDFTDDRTYTFVCPRASAPSAAVGDTLLIDGTTYGVILPRPDTALLTLDLKPL